MYDSSKLGFGTCHQRYAWRAPEPEQRSYVGLVIFLIVLMICALLASSALGQTPTTAPYAFTDDGKIEPTADQKPGTIAALMHDDGTGWVGWTDATTAGFGVPDLADRKLIYRDGADGPVYVVAIEVPCMCLSAPAPYDADRYGPFPGEGMTIWHDDIAPGPGTIGWHPPAGAAPGLGAHHRTYVVQIRYIGKEPGKDHDWHTVAGGTHSSDQSAMDQCSDIQQIAWQHRHGPHQCRIVER